MRISEIKNHYDVYSGWKVAHWMKDIEKIKNGELIPPKFIGLHPEAFCSHRCKHCAYRYSRWDKHGMNFLKPEWAGKPDFSRERPIGKLVPGVSDIPKEVALSLPKQMNEEGIKAIEITGSGEPMLYPPIKDLLKECSKWLDDVAVVTNGEFFTEDKMDCLTNLTWLRFSIDACHKETHKKIHGVDSFGKIIKNLKLAIDKFPEAYIGISFIITKDNYTEILEAARFYKELGVRNIRFSFEYEPTGTANLTQDQIDIANTLINEAKKEQNSHFKVFGMVGRIELFSKPNIDFNFCGYQLFSWNLGYDCKFYPCCIQIYHPEYAFGDLRKQTLHEIIYGEERRKFIDNFDVKKCHNCWLRDKNIAIETLLAPEKRLGHVNFI